MHQIRSVTRRDITALGRLLNDIFRGGDDAPKQDVLSDFPLVFAPENYRNCRVLERDGRIVSHAAIFPCRFVLRDVRFKMAVIVLVATSVEHQRCGYAARLMLDLQRTLHEEAYDLGILWTGIDDFYRKLGWQVVTPRGWFTDDLRTRSGLLERLASDSEPPTSIERYEGRLHLPGVMRLHDAEDVRTRRSPCEYAALLTLPRIRVWVARRGKSVSAYVVIGQAVNKHGVIEYGGPADDVLHLIRHALRAGSMDRELPLLINHLRRDLRQRFEKAGEPLHPLEASMGRGCEMLYIVDPENLPLSSLRDVFIWGLDYT